MHETPESRMEVKGKKKPPFWNRLVLIVSAMGVSFVHGSNDGQKGIGLIMLVLIGIVPAKFVLGLLEVVLHGLGLLHQAGELSFVEHG